MLSPLAIIVTISLLRGVYSQVLRPPSTFPPLSAASVDQLFESQIHGHAKVGFSIAVVRDGKLGIAKGYGPASLGGSDPVTVQTRFSIGSVTKQFTSACVLMLADEGKLSVYDKVAKYYPNLSGAADISILDLMNHVSGYHDYYPLDFVDRRMRKPINADGIIVKYATQKLDFKPGTRWSYSNTNYVLLSRIIEQVAGISLGGFLKDRIFDPLGMTKTSYEPTHRGSGYARGYTVFALGEPEDAVPEGRGWLGGAGGIVSTPSDLARWDIALMDGKVLGRESMKLMTTPRLLTDGSSTSYGCGLNIRKRDGTTVWDHGGSVSGFVAENILVPETRSALIYCINRDNAWDQGVRARVVPTLLPTNPSVSEGSQSIAPSVARTEALIPAVAGEPVEALARRYFLALQDGNVATVPLGDEFRAYLGVKRVKSASERLRALGPLSKVDVGQLSERGGMAVCEVTFTLGSTTLRGQMYRSADGRIQQLIVR